MRAYLHFGTGSEPRQTVSVDAKETERPRKGRTQSGYGHAIPTEYMVKWSGKWRRVYVAQFGNAGSAFIGRSGAWVATVDIER
jgi:hypothetical protein